MPWRSSVDRQAAALAADRQDHRVERWRRFGADIVTFSVREVPAATLPKISEGGSSSMRASARRGAMYSIEAVSDHEPGAGPDFLTPARYRSPSPD